MTLEDIIDLAAKLELSEDFVRSVTAPCVLLQGTSAMEVFSRLGGQPELPSGVGWPVWDVSEYDARELADAEKQAREIGTEYCVGRAAKLRERGRREPLPLSFLAQLDLSDLAGAETGLPLPEDGYLWFFHELTEQPWGYCPTHRGGFRVLYAPADTKLESRAAPPGAEVLASKSVAAVRSWSFVTWPELTEQQFDAYESLQDAVLPDVPAHQVGGLPQQIQGDMPRACALVTKGVHLGRPPHIPEDELDRLAADAPQWRLLLQLDSDDDLHWMWGDAGLLYWWMREEDIAAGAWDRAWFQMQCG